MRCERTAAAGFIWWSFLHRAPLLKRRPRPIPLRTRTAARAVMDLQWPEQAGRPSSPTFATTPTRKSRLPFASAIETCRQCPCRTRSSARSWPACVRSRARIRQWRQAVSPAAAAGRWRWRQRRGQCTECTGGCCAGARPRSGRCDCAINGNQRSAAVHHQDV